MCCAADGAGWLQQRGVLGGLHNEMLQQLGVLVHESGDEYDRKLWDCDLFQRFLKKVSLTHCAGHFIWLVTRLRFAEWSTEATTACQ